MLWTQLLYVVSRLTNKLSLLKGHCHQILYPIFFPKTPQNDPLTNRLKRLRELFCFREDTPLQSF